MFQQNEGKNVMASRQATNPDPWTIHRRVILSGPLQEERDGDALALGDGGLTTDAPLINREDATMESSANLFEDVLRCASWGMLPTEIAAVLGLPVNQVHVALQFLMRAQRERGEPRGSWLRLPAFTSTGNGEEPALEVYESADELLLHAVLRLPAFCEPDDEHGDDAVESTGQREVK